MGLANFKEIWKKAIGLEAARDDSERKTTATPLGMNSIFAPFRTSGVQNVLPKPTAANLRGTLRRQRFLRRRRARGL